MSTRGKWEFVVVDIHLPIGAWYHVTPARAHTDARHTEFTV